MATKNYFVFLLHPCTFSPLPFLTGFKSFIDSFEWQGSNGNIIAVIPRTGGKPKYYDAPGSFMWHALNAYEKGNEIIGDFVGYDDPDHFIGENALMKNMMQGYNGNAHCSGTVRRYIIDLNSDKLTEEILDTANHEFPMMDNRVSMKEHRYGYLASGGLGAFNSGVKRIDYQTFDNQEFDFGPFVQVGEPVFVPSPSGNQDEGWLISQCLDGNQGKTFFAIFDADTVGKGPIAKVWLSHPVPISFHGSWSTSDWNKS